VVTNQRIRASPDKVFILPASRVRARLRGAGELT
jgi:hypothetical protein